MHDIFLSYATKDRDRLRPLVKALEAQGWSVFWDHRSIKVAQDWHDVIGTAIQQCPCVIVAWSQNSVVSRWVREEALIARDRGVLYPVLLDRVAPPFGFTLMQAADFTVWNGKDSYPEFVKLKEQLSIRLLLKPLSEPQSLHNDSGETLAHPVKEVVPRSGFVLKSLGAVGVLVMLGAAGYGVMQSGLLDSGMTTEPVAEAPVVVEAPKQEVKPIEQPQSKPPETYPLILAGFPGTAVVTVNGQSYQAGQRFEAGSYTVKVAVKGYQPLEQQVELSEQNTEFQLPLPFAPEMVKVEGGTFTMGCRDDVDGGCSDDEKPDHNVTVETFLLAKTEVTVGQFRAFVEATSYKTTAEEQGSCWSYDAKGKWNDVKGKSWKKLGFEQPDNRPVACVSWKDAGAYVKWLGDKTGKTWRLPSEAEWEYAARGNTETAYFWGNEIGKNNANCWKAQCGDAFEFTSPVGSFAENQFGLSDMNGNVWEWVQDRWHSNYEGAPTDGSAWESGDSSYRVLRGGSWDYYSRHLRSANRRNNTPVNRGSNIGFRPAQVYGG